VLQPTNNNDNKNTIIKVLFLTILH